MKLKSNSDQPAFPINEETTDRVEEGVRIYTGLTKREEFAKTAMEGILSNPLINHFGEDEIDWIAKKSVKLADEMLKQLGEKDV